MNERMPSDLFISGDVQAEVEPPFCKHALREVLASDWGWLHDF